MRLATSTCTFPKRRDGSYTTLIDSISMCHACGFDVIDLNFCNANRPESELRADDWERQIDLIGNHAAKLGVTFSQSHPPYDSNLWRADRNLTDDDRAFYYEGVRRSLYASGQLGVKWSVVHAQTDVLDNECSFEQNLRRNLEFYAPLLDWAKQYGTGIAIENMAEFHPDKTRMRFTAVVEEQIAIIDALNDPSVGGCWDFGHAQMVYRDQVPALRKLGHRLKATHVQENDKFHDDHFIPFVRGTTPWEKIMPLLKEIGYTGDFTYECHGFMAGVPDELRPAAGRFAYEVGMYCIGLYEKA
jgi:sugar phosphate isomerase/epimerase